MKKGFFNKVISKVLEELKLGRENLAFSLSIVDSKRMKELNRNYRGKNKTTDVLSFSYVKDGKLSNAELLRFIKKEKIVELGDIFIDPSVAKKQAQQVKNDGHSLEYEFAMLTTHGLLHLLGYDHERSKKDEKRVYDLQAKILKGLHL
ncbi:MAG: rRNA maturation RNase YbeY [Parcubacteria group bacterium]|nr:rRNA maturation RNase YbeY [Parcubacteria group bacterium]